jgi:NADH:ubiquinone oxidoreductase subunit 3 (subunit A)
VQRKTADRISNKQYTVSIPGKKGFEPLTFGFGDHYSTIENTPLLVCTAQLSTQQSTLMEFAPILIYIVVSFLLTILLLGLSFLFAASNNLSYPEKLSAYECGFDPFDDARSRFDVRFYLVSILFIIFDLEVTFLFPWAVCLESIGMFGFWSMMLFLWILTIGFIYEWKKGALEWE